MTIVRKSMFIFIIAAIFVSFSLDTFAVDAAPIGEDLQPTETENLEFVSSENVGNTQVNVIVADYGLPGSTTPEGESWLDGGSGDGLIESLFGSYRPYDSSGVAAVDWGWIADVAAFLLMIFCLFKLLGGVIRRG